MRFLWLDVNASYSHSSLAIPALHAQLSKELEGKHSWHIVSGSKNKDICHYISEIINYKPDFILSTLWLFNHSYVISILERCKKILPHTKVVLGGPEFLGENMLFLKREHYVDAVFRGEGEEIFPLFVENCEDVTGWQSLKGFCFINSANEYIDNGYAVSENFSYLNAPEESLFFPWDKPFIQLETSRGCFNRCGFCISGNGLAIRDIAIEVIKNRIKNIAEKGIKEIRILDRTFNGNEKRAIELLSIFEQFPEIEFHLEVHPSLLGTKIREKLKTLPPKLLHIEAGIQSLNNNVLKASGRRGEVSKALDGIEFLVSLEKFEVHCDLIAGLPHYSFDNLLDDLIQLLKVNPAEIQLELLKILPGTEFCINAKRLKLTHSDLPPYEILMNSSISYPELNKITIISKIIEMFFNRSIWRDLFRDIALSGKELFTTLLSFIGESEFNYHVNNEEKGLLLYGFCKHYYEEGTEKLLFTHMKNGLSFKNAVGIKSKLWRRQDSLPNPVFNEESPDLTYRYIEYSNKRTWFVYDKKSNNFNSIREFTEIL